MVEKGGEIDKFYQTKASRKIPERLQQGARRCNQIQQVR